MTTPPPADGKKLSKIQYDDGSVIKYSYADNQLVKTEIFVGGSTQVAWYAYSYTNGKLTKTEGYTRKPGGARSTTPTLKYEKEYYSNGNLKKLTLFYKDPATGALDKTNEFVFSQYDTNPNTTALVENNPYMPMESFISNNPLSELHYDSFGNLEETVMHIYTYDASGTPLNPQNRNQVNRLTGIGRKRHVFSLIH